MLKKLLASDTGRDLLAKALIAGAGAAAAVMLEEKSEITDAASKGKRKGAKALNLVGRAFHDGTDAALDVLREAAASVLPKKYRKNKDDPRKGVALH